MRARIPMLRRRQVVIAERCKHNALLGYQTQAFSTALQTLPITSESEELEGLNGQFWTKEQSDFRESSQRTRSNAARPRRAKKTVARFGWGGVSSPRCPYHGYEPCALTSSLDLG